MNLRDISEALTETAAADLRGCYRYAPDDESKLAECERVLRNAEALVEAAREVAKIAKAKRDTEAAWLATKKQVAAYR